MEDLTELDGKPFLLSSSSRSSRFRKKMNDLNQNSSVQSDVRRDVMPSIYGA